MNRIILIGNGFDLAHGLKTSYKDFINNYWRDFAQKISNIFNPYEDEFVKFRTNGVLESQYDSMLATRYSVNNEKGYNYDAIINTFRQELIKDSSYANIKQLISGFNEASDLKLDLSFKNSFFEQISEKNYEQNWVDIENEYYQTLIKIAINNELGCVKTLNFDFEQIKNELERFLTRSTEDKLYQEQKIKDLIYDKIKVCDFTKVGIDRLVEENIIQYSEGKEHEDKKAIDLYELIEEEKNEGLIKDDKEYFEREVGKTEVRPKSVLLLNFNYTNTTSKYLWESRSRKSEVIHIHGELNNPKNPIVFGYGDELDDDYKAILKKNDNSLLEYVKSTKYAETNSYKKLLSFIESDSYQIFIMGHSCGNSDRTLLNTLFEHKNCQSIKIFYHENINKRGEKTDNFSDIYRNIMRNFTDFSELRAKVVDKTNSFPLPQAKKSS